MFNIALYQPDIPQNTAAIIRLCSCFDTTLEIIEPCGFYLNDKRLKRVAMDYLNKSKIIIYKSYKNFLIKKKIKYAIFTLGAYAMNSFYDHEKLFESYRKAEFILTVSDDTSECIKLIFPNFANKIFKINLSIDHKKFKIPNTKSNLITFMPRKLSDHFHILSLFLFKKLPKKWKIESLSNLKEKKLFTKLSKSKIFLSFSYLEGFGMPPLEAAIAGNKVIGYVGGGGKEYWKKPIFEEIQTGNIKQFCEKIINVVDNFPKTWDKKNFLQRKQLINKYSEINEKKLIKKLINKIYSCF